MTCEGTGACNQGRHPWCCDCGNLVTENSDGSSPHADMRSGIGRAVEFIGWAVWCIFVFVTTVIVTSWVASKLEGMT